MRSQQVASLPAETFGCLVWVERSDDRRCEMRCPGAATRKIAYLPEFLFVKGMTHEHT